MAHPEHVDIVRQGTKAIQKWRETNAEAFLYLSDANLRDVNLSDSDLSFADLSFAKLYNANLSGANLRYANLSEAKLSDADLSEADLSKANLTWANLSCADLSKANLSGADLYEAVLRKTNLSDADLSDAVLRKTNLSDADLSDAVLSNAKLSDADLSDADLNGADLNGADLNGAKLELTQLDGAHLPEAEFKEATRMIRRKILKSTAKELWGAMRWILLGVLWVLFACWLISYRTGAGNPLRELALIRGAETAPGFILDTWEDASDDGHRGTHWHYGYEYRFHAADGREYTQVTERSGELKDEFSNLNEPVPIEVEYLPDNPSVSRIKGSGSQSISEWIWRTVFLVILLAAFVAPSIYYLFLPGFRELKEIACRMTLRGSDDSASQ